MLIGYIPAEECQNEECWFTCLQCGKCGRKFNKNGYMINDGGTHNKREDEE